MRHDRGILTCCGRRSAAIVALVAILAPAAAFAVDAPGSQEEAEIRAAAKEYLAALAKGDAKALAACWTADGQYVDDRGEIHPASELVAEVRQPAGDGPTPQMKITGSKIRFLTPNVAVEDGASEVVWPDSQRDPPVRGHFHATWVKQSGRWRLASLCEIADVDPTSTDLHQLAWMVGKWMAASGGTTLEANVRWNATQTFLLRDTKAIRDGEVVMRGSQRISLDPQTGNLKSWSFDSEGGYSEESWNMDDGSWVVQSTGVRPDGRQCSDTTIITFDGKNNYRRQSLDGRLGGEPLPDRDMRFTRDIAAQQ